MLIAMLEHQPYQARLIARVQTHFEIINKCFLHFCKNCLRQKYISGARVHDTLIVIELYEQCIIYSTDILIDI